MSAQPPDGELERLRAENTRLRRLLELTPEQARPPGAAQAGLFLERPGPVTAVSSARDKVSFFHTLFAARRDVYATRWENVRSGRSGWVPAVRGGWHRGTSRPYLHLTDEVLAAHLTGDVHIGLYPLLDGDVCHWLAVDFDGGSAILDALSYLKAARALGSGLLGEAIALHGRMDLSSYDWLFPSQDVLPGSGGVGNLIAAPLQGRSRRDGATVFLDLATMEPHEDQWAYLSSLNRLSPREVGRLAGSVRPVRAGAAVARLSRATASRTQPRPAPVVHVRIGAGVSVDMGELTPAVLATLKHAARSSPPAVTVRQPRRRRAGH